MRRQGGGFGFIVLLVAGVVVFLLAMHSLTKIGLGVVPTRGLDPAAQALEEGSGTPGVAGKNGAGKGGKPPAMTLDTSTQVLTAPVAPLQNPLRPRLPEMQQKVDEHTKALKQAQQQTE